LWFFLLDIQLRFSYIQLTLKRVLIKKSKLGYTTEGLRQTLVRVWLRMQQLAASRKTVLYTKQEQLLHSLRDRQGLTPSKIWEMLRVTK
jgi:hypothetical protein